MKIVFMGTPDFSVLVLQALVDAGHEIVAVYTQPPRPAGRGKADRPSAVQVRAEALGLDVRSPRSLKTDEAAGEIRALGADIGVVVAYGQILPQAVLDAPEGGCLNIHASLLPRWRGAAPIQRAIMSGDAETGVCIMQMDAGLDTGPVRARAAIPISPDETAASLHDKLAELGASEIVRVLSDLKSCPPVLQNADGVTYAKKIDKAEARVDWTKPAVEVDRLIRGLSPFPGAWSEHNETRVKLLRSECSSDTGQPGEIVGLPMTIACGRESVRILDVQRAGRGASTAEMFVRGYPLKGGDRFR